MSSKDIYCKLKAWDRLKKEGISPSDSMDIAKDVSDFVKESVKKHEKLRETKPECHCKTGTP